MVACFCLSCARHHEYVTAGSPLSASHRKCILLSETDRVPYNKQLTNRACLSRTGEYWPSVVTVRTERSEVRTAMTSGQYSPVRPSRSVSKRLLFFLSLRAGGILQILQSDWFRERAVFYDLAREPGRNRWQLHSQVCLLL